MTATSQPIVAVVDDDPRIRESLESLIESAGLKARVFSLAEDFLHGELLAETSCLITDVRMPKMDGLELQRRVRLARPELQRRVRLARPELPVIFITGHHEDDVERLALAQGAASFLRKPFDAGELLRATRLALGETSGNNEQTP